MPAIRSRIGTVSSPLPGGALRHRIGLTWQTGCWCADERACWMRLLRSYGQRSREARASALERAEPRKGAHDPCTSAPRICQPRAPVHTSGSVCLAMSSHVTRSSARGTFTLAVRVAQALVPAHAANCCTAITWEGAAVLCTNCRTGRARVPARRPWICCAKHNAVETSQENTFRRDATEKYTRTKKVGGRRGALGRT